MTYITEPRTTLPARNARRALPAIGALFNLWRQRRALAALDDAALNDIGVSRNSAQTEAARPFWDVPSHWRD